MARIVRARGYDAAGLEKATQLNLQVIEIPNLFKWLSVGHLWWSRTLHEVVVGYIWKVWSGLDLISVLPF